MGGNNQIFQMIMIKDFIEEAAQMTTIIWLDGRQRKGILGEDNGIIHCGSGTERGELVGQQDHLIKQCDAS